MNYFYLMFSHNNEIIIQIKEFRPDIIMGFGILTAYFGSQQAKRNNLPFIYYWIDALDTLIPEKIFHSIGRLIERISIKNSASLFVTNEKLKDHIIALGAEKNAIEIFSSGIDFNRFNAFIDGSKIRSRYGILNTDTVLFFMGWIYHFSGLKEIACLLGESKDEYSQVKLLVVGEGDAYEDLKNIQKKYSLYNTLILTGRQPYKDIPEFIAASDYCILPAYPDEKIMQDIVPIKILEYMALGKPVIATKLPGLLKEFGMDNGILFVDFPSDTLTCALDPVNQKKSLELREKALNYVKKYNWNVITDRFEQTLTKILIS
jgi:glycosyltransferase involved in cell wall biosynthesis